MLLMPILPPEISGILLLQSIDKLFRFLIRTIQNKVQVIGHQNENKYYDIAFMYLYRNIVHPHTEILRIHKQQTVLKMLRCH